MNPHAATECIDRPMGVQEAGPKLFAHVKKPVQPRALNGKRVAIDLASFMLRT